MKNKGQTESYSFLIGVLLTIIILTGIGCAVYSLFASQRDMQRTFDNFAKDLNELKGTKDSQEPKEAMIQIKKEFMIVAFDKKPNKDPDEFFCKPKTEEQRQIKTYTQKLPYHFFIKKPYSEQCLSKACICLCPNHYEFDACTDKSARCTTIESADTFIGGKGCMSPIYEGDGTLSKLEYIKEGNVISFDSKGAYTLDEYRTYISRATNESKKTCPKPSVCG